MTNQQAMTIIVSHVTKQLHIADLYDNEDLADAINHVSQELGVPNKLTAEDIKDNDILSEIGLFGGDIDDLSSY